MEYTCEHCGCVNDVSTKSNPQNKYYRGVLLKYVQRFYKECGNLFSLDECHQIITRGFMTYVKDGVKFAKSTSNGNWERGEWEEKMNEIRIYYATEHNFIIPEPNEDTHV